MICQVLCKVLGDNGKQKQQGPSTREVYTQDKHYKGSQVSTEDRLDKNNRAEGLFLNGSKISSTEYQGKCAFV